MSAGLLARAKAVFLRVFPERQIYLRSDGRVSFVVLSSRAQAIGVALTFGALTWVAYASVMTAFKDEIVSAMRDRQKTIQNAYEAQIAALRLDYDDLNVKLAMAESRFAETVADIERRSAALKSAMAEREGATAALDEIEQRAETVRRFEGRVREDSEGDDAAGGPEQPIEGEPEQAKPATETEAAPAAAEPASEKRADAAISPDPSSDFLASGRNVAVGRSLAQLDTRLSTVVDSQARVAREIAEDAGRKEAAMRAVLAAAGVDADRLARPETEGTGGPFIALEDAASVAGAASPEIAEAHAALDRLDALQTAMLAIPLAVPAPEAWRINSGFGARRDPFSGRWAFHNGLDFKGDAGQPIVATAPGKVVKAGWGGGYGNMVEVEHGLGLKTRYAHLKSISVAEGDEVKYGEEVGKLGNTGRSTGAHLHYEVWLDGQARDPMLYLKAGIHVLEIR